MKNKRLMILTLALVSYSITLPVQAESWWKKGAGILNALTGGSSVAEPGVSEIGAAFKEALRIGSEQVTAQLGKTDGFNKDPAIHIPLPEQLNSVKQVLAKIGLSGPVDTLEMKMNRAAEVATPKAKKLFVDAIKAMTFDDVLAIYKGPADSATQYFREKMSPSLMKEMTPIVDSSLAEVGAVKAFDTVMNKYDALPFVPKVESDLTGHVVNKAIDGIFYYMAQEEKAIREDPRRQTTALLKRVFGK